MKKNCLTSFIFAVVFFLSAGLVKAEEVCTQSYGQPVVCGAKTEEVHVPVNTGLFDFNPTIIGASFISISGVLFYISRKRNIAK